MLTESLCLSTIGGAAGIAFLFVAKASLVRAIPEGLPRLNDITMNWSVLLFAALVTFASGVIFGCAPAIAARRPEVMPTLQTSSRGASSSRRQARTRSALVVAEFALSIVLMIAAGLLLRSFRDLMHRAARIRYCERHDGTHAAAVSERHEHRQISNRG